MKGMFKLTVFLTVVALMAASAYATPTLRISSGGASCTLADGAAAAVCVGGGSASGGDNSSVVGAVGGSFVVGLFDINFSAGVTKPAHGSAGSPYMDVSTLSHSTGAGTLVLEFSETGFSGIGSSFISFGGTTQGTVTYSAYYDPGNALFAATTLLATSGPKSGGAYSGGASGGATSGAAYSITQVLTIVHTGAANSSGDHELTVPEPGILSLLGVGLASLGLIRRRLS